MELSPAEQNFYNLVFSKLIREDLTLHNTECVSLVKRGIDDHHIRKQIWSRVFPSGSRGAISKENLFKLLKYIAAYQHGIQVDHTTFQILPTPNLPKMSEKRAAQEPEPNTEIEREDRNQQERIPLRARSTNEIIVRQGVNTEVIAKDKQKPENKLKGDIILNKENVDKEGEFGFIIIEDETTSQIRSDEIGISLKLDVSFDLFKKDSSYDNSNGKNQTKIQIISSLKYKNYIIQSKFPSEEIIFFVERSYGDFKWFNSQLQSQPEYKGLNFPKLPPKNKDANLLIRELEIYLQELGKHGVFGNSKFLRLFLSDQGDENFKTLSGAVKERPSISQILPDFQDWIHRLIAGSKIDCKRKDFTFKEEDADERINDLLRRKEHLNKITATLQKKIDSSKNNETAHSGFDVQYTKIMNQAQNKRYSSLVNLANAFVPGKNLQQKKSSILENVMTDLRSINTRLEGFEESYKSCIQIAEEISAREKKRLEGLSTMNSSTIAKDISMLEQGEIQCRNNFLCDLIDLSIDCDQVLSSIVNKLRKNEAGAFKQLLKDLSEVRQG